MVSNSNSCEFILSTFISLNCCFYFLDCLPCCSLRDKHKRDAELIKRVDALKGFEYVLKSNRSTRRQNLCAISYFLKVQNMFDVRILTHQGSYSSSNDIKFDRQTCCLCLPDKVLDSPLKMFIRKICKVLSLL